LIQIEQNILILFLINFCTTFFDINSKSEFLMLLPLI
jgi:hypothetical protein